MDKNIIVYDAEEFEIIPIQKGVNNVAPCRFELYQRPENIELNKKRSGKSGELRRYINYFKGGWTLFNLRNRLQHMICWQQFYGLTFAFFCAVFHVNKPCQVIVANYTYKEKSGKARKPYFWFMKKCLQGEYVDYIHIPSNLYAKRVCELFAISIDKVIVHPFGVLDEYKNYSKLPVPKGVNEAGYFLAIGRSNRDYDFLIKVWESIHYPLVIATDTYRKDCNNPYINIRNDIDADHQYEWINNCKAVIICLDDGNIASGDTVLLTSMMLEKIVLVSSPSTLAEMYIETGINGLAVHKDITAFRKSINETIEGKYENVGKKAREVFLAKYERKHLGEALGKYVK